MSAIRWWAVVLMLVLAGVRAAAHETDQFAIPPARQFADLGDFFNRWAYEAIRRGVDVTNVQIRQALAQKRDPHVMYEVQSPPHVTMAVRSQWPWSVTQIETFERQLQSARMRRRYPGRVVAYGERFAGVYQLAFFPLDVRQFAHILFFSSTIKVYGTYLGTDKLGHLTDEGINYYFAYRSARDAGADEKEAVAKAALLGTDGLMSERGVLGLLANADYSNGDLSANFAGFLFYRNLTEPVMLKGRLCPPMLLRDGPYWKLADDVRPDSGFFARFISDHLDEALNPGFFDPMLRPGLRAGVRARTALLLQHYCDEHGQPHPREWFDQKLQELSTYWGVDYGHLGSYDELVSIGNSCFDAVKRSPRQGPTDSNVRLASAIFDGPLWESADHPVPADRPISDGAALDLALRERRPEVVRALLIEGADPNHRDRTGVTPLHRACRWPSVAATLINRGARVNASDARGRTPLHWAADERQGTSVPVLLDEGARPDATDHDGRTPLHVAAARGNLTAVAALLRHGAAVGRRDHFGQTALHLAAGASESAVSALLGAGAIADARDDFGRTPLHEAARAGTVEEARRLIDAGANSRATDDYGITPLHLACRRGSAAMVRLLLERGADPNARAAAGATPLHDAVLSGDETVVRLLLDNSALPITRDAKGRTAAEVASEHGFDRVKSEIHSTSIASSGGSR